MSLLVGRLDRGGFLGGEFEIMQGDEESFPPRIRVGKYLSNFLEAMLRSSGSCWLLWQRIVDYLSFLWLEANTTYNFTRRLGALART
jgi:hypothetical protein